ncbi:MAG TPA: ANTAR domain-containing protein [Actinomycetota bacterium]|nr:ANTAR domain-containing protein [Actinomycetota bacterium]
MINGCLRASEHGPPASVFLDTRREGRCPFPMLVTLTMPTTKIKPATVAPSSSATPMTMPTPVVVIPSDGQHLQAILAVLIDDLTGAVPSFLGLTVTVRLAGEPITLTTIEPRAMRAVRSSLQVRLPPSAGAGAGAGSMMVFYARKVHAFAELAADARRLFGLADEVLVDRHLLGGDVTPGPSAATDPAQAAAVHRAVGWLIDHGLPPDAAAQELRRRAAATGRSLAAAAQALMKDSKAGDHPDNPAP